MCALVGMDILKHCSESAGIVTVSNEHEDSNFIYILSYSEDSFPHTRTIPS